MISKEELLEIINEKIKKDENPGYNTGGSGHKGFLEFEINQIETKQIDNKLEIWYRYTLFVETEFTYYPDNPPREYPRQKKIIVDENKTILQEEEIPFSSRVKHHEDIPWEEAKKKILDYLHQLLTMIEWKYGDNRAPFKYPPVFNTLETRNYDEIFQCIIFGDMDGEEERKITASTPGGLIQKVLTTFGDEFSWIE